MGLVTLDTPKVSSVSSYLEYSESGIGKQQIRESKLSFVLKFGMRRNANVWSRQLLFMLVSLWIGVPVFAKSHETGFLDRTITLQGVTYKYQVFVPDSWTPRQKWPVVLFLHGSGERADDGLQQTDTGIGTAIRVDRTRIPAIVVMPQCRKNLWWVEPPMADMAIATLEAASKEFHGDASRTYLTGLSMGGYGTWYLAQKYPGRFAALVVICGGIHPPVATLKAHPELIKWAPEDGPKSYAEAAARVGKVPVWIFHGADDEIVPVTESQRMQAAMKQIGAEVHYTEYPGIKHVSWDKAYDESKLFPWLFSKSLPPK
jgi:predicted peptidase